MSDSDRKLQVGAHLIWGVGLPFYGLAIFAGVLWVGIVYYFHAGRLLGERAFDIVFPEDWR